MGEIAADTSAGHAHMLERGRAPFEPITQEERDRWHAIPEIRKLLNHAAALDLHEFRATVAELRARERPA